VGAYLRARLIRIYVPYLPVGIGMFLLYLMLPTLSAADRSPGLVTSLTLLPSNSPPALSVAWTLVHEMIFYCIYAAFFVNRKALYAALCGWAVAIACLHFSGAALSRFQEYVFSPLNLCFLLGVVVFHIRRIQAPPCVALGLGAVGVALVGFVANTTDPNRTVSALGFALLVLAGTSVRGPQAKVPRPLVALGAASYAIYLIHNPFISLFVRGVRVATPSLDTWGAFAAISCAAIVAGGAYWTFYERRALRWVRARVPNSAQTSADKVAE
jgi:exopolysaccharide production protein ExoZ